MVNILIVDDDLYNGIKLMNYITKRSENAKVYAVVENENDALEVLKEDMIDVILLDYKIGIDFFECHYQESRYMKSCILISTPKDECSKFNENDFVFASVEEDATEEYMYEKIEELIAHKEREAIDRDIKRKIVKELLYLGYDFSRKGTKYLVDTINYIINNNIDEIDSLEREIYPYIASIYRDEVTNVKANITRATNDMYCSCNMEKFKQYFYLNKDSKPKTRMIINAVIRRVYDYDKII